MAQVVIRRPLDAEVRSNARYLFVGFLVDEKAMGQGFLRKLRFSLSLSRHQCPIFHSLIHHRCDIISATDTIVK